MRFRRLLLALALPAFLALLFLLPAATLRAQVQVDVKLRRHTFLAYEPIELILIITNLAGRDLVFENRGEQQWLDLQVLTADGEHEMAATEPDLNLNALLVPAGQTVKRAFDVGPHYALRDAGGYRLRASVFLPEADRYFASNFVAFDLSTGKTIWRQTVGVPLGDPAGGGGGLRTLSLLTLRLPDRQLLYVRVRDEAAGVTYATRSLGRLLASAEEPQVALDAANHLHVLHLVVPRTYLYSEIGLDGARINQGVYLAESARKHPLLARGPGGRIAVVGGQLQTARPPGEDLAAGTTQPSAQPRLSDRPAGLPKPVR